MPKGNESGLGYLSLVERVERNIVQRTGGRICGLRAELCDGRLIVHGFAATYSIKQLALHAAREMVDGALAVDLDVQIAPMARRLESPVYGKAETLSAGSGG
jgi:hypothetical protein